MRSSRPALFLTALALCGAGCFSDRGLAIEIDVGDTDATSVELYVGNTACTDHDNPAIRCDGGIAPENVSEHLAGKVWFRSDLVPYFAPVKGGKASFRLQADKMTTLPIAIAVGLTANAGAVGTATLRDLAVPVDNARVITATLTAADDFGPSPGSPTQDRAMVWNQPEDSGSSCVVVEHRIGSIPRDFIVPADDPDCDGFTDSRECDKAAHLASIIRDGGPVAPACFVGVNSQGNEPCRLGGFACVDGLGPTDMCLTTRDEVCVPKQFCGCGSPTPATSCLELKIDTNTVPHIACTVRSSLEGACKGQSELVDLGPHLVDATCEQPRLSLLELDTVANAGRSRDFDGVDLELRNPNDACRFTVQVNSGKRRLPTEPILEPDLDYGMVRLAPRDGGQAVLVPIVFTFEIPLPRACEESRPLECNFVDHDVPDDPMWGCVP